MALSVPLSLLVFPGQFFDLGGLPLASGWLTFYAAGTTTPQDVYADDQGDATLTNPVQLDASGMAQVFLGSVGLYDVKVSAYNSSTPSVPGATLYTVSGVGNPGQILFAGLGNTLTAGSQNVTSGYTVLSTDNLVTVASTGGPNPCIVNLPTAASRTATNNGNGLLLTIKNVGNIPLSVKANGAETIDLAATYTVPAAAAPLYPAITIASDGTSAWWVLSALGI